MPRLVYYLHDEPSAFRLELAGSLLAGNAAELERVWRTGSSTLGTRTFVVDVEKLTSVDDAGRRLLGRWRQLGAAFVAESRPGRDRLWNQSRVRVWNARLRDINGVKIRAGTLGHLSCEYGAKR